MDFLSSVLSDASRIRELSKSEHMPIGTDSGTLFEFLKEYIEDFQSKLDSEHEVGLLLTNFGQSVLLTVTHISYEPPVLMIFKGYMNGKEATLIQHVNQLNFLLTSVEKEPDRPKRKVGFVSE